jgi:homoserine kinase
VPLEVQLAFLSDEEGHPDNVVPALVGGLCVVGFEGGELRHLRLRPHRGLSVALCVPEVEVSTPEARRILPHDVPHHDAAFTAGRMAFLMAGLLEGRNDALRIGVQDRLHQDHRAPLIGPVSDAFAMAEVAGAAGAFVSGSGSTLAAFVPEGVPGEDVAEAMCAPFRARGVQARALLVRPVPRGALVEG